MGDGPVELGVDVIGMIVYTQRRQVRDPVARWTDLKLGVGATQAGSLAAS